MRTYGKGSKLCTKHKMGLVEAACPYCEINRLRENIKHEIDVDQVRINVEIENSILREALEYLWQIIDDIDTYGDMAKGDDKLFRGLVERRQKDRWNTGITTDGYILNLEALQRAGGEK